MALAKALRCYDFEFAPSLGTSSYKNVTESRLKDVFTSGFDGPYLQFGARSGNTRLEFEQPLSRYTPGTTSKRASPLVNIYSD